MTDILCNWLNDEVKLSKRVDPSNFSKEFSTGFLIGEVLHKYELQDDFDQFSQNKTANARLNNFTRIEPVLHLLEVPFDTNIARSIMTEQHGIATRLMYQVFISLNRKTKANLTGVAMETMRPAAPVKLEAVESGIFKERLKMITPRQTDLNLDSLKAHYHQKQIAMETTAFKERFHEEERHMHALQEHRKTLILKYKDNQSKKSEMLAKIQAATVHVPKPPPSRTAKAIAMQRSLHKAKETEMMKYDIEGFEEKMKRAVPPSKPIRESTGTVEDADLPDSIDLIKPVSNDEYIGKIRKRLHEDASARAEREKRRRKVLVDQLCSHEAQEEARREEMLVNRLMRQSQQERRIAVQLLQARHEKDVIRSNRLIREKQYEDRRLREFEDALNRESEMARLVKMEYLEQTQKDHQLHNEIAANRAQQRYNKHYAMCMDVLLSIVDFATKVGEYRELTNRLLPGKLMREWTELFVAGQPLYENSPEVLAIDEEPSPEKILEQERQALLDEGDFTEYRNMVGEWQPPSASNLTGPPSNNPIVGHIVQRLFNIVHPPTPPPPPPEFPPFSIKACVLGKVFSGKTSTVQKLAANHRLQVLSTDDLVTEAVEANKNGEMAEQQELDDLSDEERELPEKPSTAASENATTGQKTPVIPDGSVETDNRMLEEQATTEKDDGAEKGDPEKPIEDEPSTHSLNVDPTVTKQSRLTTPHSRSSSRPQSRPSIRPQASARAKLGGKALKFLKRGKPVDDQLSIDILVERIKRIPEGMGWILDGFPTTYQQAKLLEKALTGMEVAANVTKKSSKSCQSTLAPDPRPTPPPPESGSGINVVIYFDLPDELCLRRSAGRTFAMQSEEQFQQEFNPPPEGSSTGVNKQEKVIPMEDPAHDQEQIQHRLTTFQDQWPKLEKWYMRFGTLCCVDGSQEAKTVYLEVEKILEDTLRKIQGGDVEESDPIEVTETQEEPKPPEPEPLATPEPPQEEESRSRPTSRKGSRTGSAKRSGSRGSAKGDKSKSPGRSASKADTGKKSVTGKENRAPSAKRSKSGKKGKTPELEPEPEPEPPSTPLPIPGSDQWEFVDQSIAEELALILASQWEAVEDQYVDGSKLVFHNVREEREIIIRYFYQIRKDFQAFLRRPDHKQEFITAWQQEYNDLAYDLRDDEESRAELHQRVDDLRERLWSICDDRKISAEGERECVIKDGWLDDHIGLLLNHYITLCQGEVDRFQDTTRLLRDYYKGMEGKIPEEQSAEYARIPLIQLPIEGRPESTAHSMASGEGTADRATRPTTPADEVKSSASKSRTPSGKRKKVAEPRPEDLPPADATGEEMDRRPKIPLVPRRPLSPDAAAAQAAAKGGKPDKGGKGGKLNENTDLPPPPEDPDDRLLYDAYVTAITAIDRIITAEQAAREAEEEAERARELEKEKEKEKEKAAAAKGKGGKGGKGGKKSRSPSPKKGKNSPSALTPQPSEELSEEDKEAKKIHERARVEFFAAIEQEALAAKARLKLVRSVAMGIVADLRDKADAAYKDMNDWLGARFLKEMESIDHLSEVVRNAIETSTHIKEELLINQEDFLVNEEVLMPQFEKDFKVLRTPSPIPRPPPLEPAHPDSFTVDQIVNLHQQFALTAPSGLLSTKAFHDTFIDLTALTHGTEQIPDIWMAVSPEKLDLIVAQLSPDGEYIDWRTLILAVSEPWPHPSQAELLDTLQHFSNMDQKATGYVTREQFDRVDLWFSGPQPLTPTDPAAPYPYDRVANLKMTFFDVFADHNTDPSQLDYVEMLLYFAISPDPYNGFLRALSVASGTHMPRLPHKILEPSRPSSQASLAASIDLEIIPASEDGFNEDIPEEAVMATVPLDALDKVLHHGQSMRGDSHRFSVTADPEDAFSCERLAGVYRDLNSENLDPVSLATLIEHPVIQDIMSTLQTYKAVDLRAILLNPGPDVTDAHSIKTGE